MISLHFPNRFMILGGNLQYCLFQKFLFILYLKYEKKQGLNLDTTS